MQSLALPNVSTMVDIPIPPELLHLLRGPASNLSVRLSCPQFPKLCHQLVRDVNLGVSPVTSILF